MPWYCEQCGDEYVGDPILHYRDLHHEVLLRAVLGDSVMSEFEDMKRRLNAAERPHNHYVGHYVIENGHGGFTDRGRPA